MLTKLIERCLIKRKLILLYRIDGSAIGDMLCLTAYSEALYNRYKLRCMVISKYPELYFNLPHIAKNIDFRRFGIFSKPLVKWFCRKASSERIFAFAYANGKKVAKQRFDSDHRRPVSLTQMLSEHIPYVVDYVNLCPVIIFSAEEKQKFSDKFSSLNNYALIKPRGHLGWSPNKEWVFERYQEVVSQTPKGGWVQIGDIGDPLLEGVIDLRGQTSLRELFWLIAHARLVFSTEGLYNHAAAAFGTPSVVIFSGVTQPGLATYPNTVAILREPQVPCAPCWLTTPCPVKGKPCTSDITTEQALNELKRLGINDEPFSSQSYASNALVNR